jgi:lipoate---protein ligase
VASSVQMVFVSMSHPIPGACWNRPTFFKMQPPQENQVLEKMHKLPWRLIPESSLSPSLNVALDEHLLEETIAGRTSPSLRFWGWNRSAVILGSSQSVQNEVCYAELTREKLALVRRISGGGTMFVEPDGVITYSIIMPEAILQGLSIVESYEFLDRFAVRALKEFGVEANYAPINDIVSPIGKIGGAAQARRRGFVLHHTMIAYCLDLEKLAAVLRRGVKSTAKRVSPLVNHLKLDRSLVVDRLVKEFEMAFGLDQQALSELEIEKAGELVRQRYDTREWTFSVP